MYLLLRPSLRWWLLVTLTRWWTLWCYWACSAPPRSWTRSRWWWHWSWSEPPIAQRSGSCWMKVRRCLFVIYELTGIWNVKVLLCSELWICFISSLTWLWCQSQCHQRHWRGSLSWLWARTRSSRRRCCWWWRLCRSSWSWRRCRWCLPSLSRKRSSLRWRFCWLSCPTCPDQKERWKVGTEGRCFFFISYWL